jgi:tetratricopeptide (TPR) repeat protein
MLAGLFRLDAEPAQAVEILSPSTIVSPSTILYPSLIQGPSEVIFPANIQFPAKIVFPNILRFPSTVTYPARVAPSGPVIVHEEDVPHLDPLTVKWLLGDRDHPMVPMRVLPDGHVVPLNQSVFDRLWPSGLKQHDNGPAADPGERIDACWLALKAQDYRRAMEAGRKAVESAPRSFAAHFCLGDANLKSGDLPAALTAFTSAESLASTPRDLFGSSSRIGRVFQDMQDFERAFQYHQRAMTLAKQLGDKGDEAATLRNLAMLHRDRGDLDQAVALFEEGMQLDPEAMDAVSYNNLALLYLDRGGLQNAERYLRQAIAMSERAGDFHNAARQMVNLGNVLEKQGQTDQAERILLDALGRLRKIGDTRGEVMALTQLARLYGGRGDRVKAVRLLLEASWIQDGAVGVAGGGAGIVLAFVEENPFAYGLGSLVLAAGSWQWTRRRIQQRQTPRWRRFVVWVPTGTFIVISCLLWSIGGVAWWSDRRRGPGPAEAERPAPQEEGSPAPAVQATPETAQPQLSEGKDEPPAPDAVEATPETAQIQFSEGDRVRLVSSDGPATLTIDQSGTQPGPVAGHHDTLTVLDGMWMSDHWAYKVRTSGNEAGWIDGRLLRSADKAFDPGRALDTHPQPLGRIELKEGSR